MFKVPEKFRVTTGLMKSDASYGNNGQFIVRSLKLKQPLMCQSGEGYGWEHVSVSVHNRCPTWPEMAFIKDLFWEKDDLVVQMHPPESDYVNNHPYCLHLWRKVGSNDFCERPGRELVGF